MESGPGDFVLTEAGSQVLDQVRAQLSTAYTVTGSDRPGHPGHPGPLGHPGHTRQTGPAQRTRRVWLDTFDWRLYRAGLTLQQVTAWNTTELVLTAHNGPPPTGHNEPPLTAVINRISRPPRWPARIENLPDGPLKDRLAKLIANRALLAVATATSQTSELRLLNPDQKTVARLHVDILAVPGHDPLPARLSVSEVRGYQAAARTARRVLAATDGISASRQTPLDAALEAAGRHPLDYTGKVDVKLRPAMPGREAVSALLLQQLDTLEANVDGVLHDTDTEFLHDLRIAVRRTRSALKLLGDQLPGELTLRFASEFRWLGDITTPLRDLDVQLAELPARAAGLVAAQAADLEPFRVYLTRRRTAARQALNRGLRSDRFATVLGDWRKALLVPKANRHSPAGPRTADLARERTRRAYNKVIRIGTAVTDDSPAESLHTLRKRCKELRYVLEFFASLHDPQAQRAMVGDLKRLQDCLGDFQDSEVQQHEIQSLAADMLARQAVPAPTLLAMGELAGQLGRRQQQARAEFAGRFAAFAGSAGRRLDALTATSGAAARATARTRA